MENVDAHRIVATSPAGARAIFEGKSLWVARRTPTARHFTVHEQTVGNVLVGVIPDDWSIRLEFNLPRPGAA